MTKPRKAPYVGEIVHLCLKHYHTGQPMDRPGIVIKTYTEQTTGLPTSKNLVQLFLMLGSQDDDGESLPALLQNRLKNSCLHIIAEQGEPGKFGTWHHIEHHIDEDPQS